MKKILHKQCIRSNDKLKIEKIRKLVARVERMLEPESNTGKEDIFEETLKFLEQVPNLLNMMRRIEQEYLMALDAAEMATSIMQKKARIARNEKFSAQKAQIYYKFIEKFTEAKLNFSEMIAIREKARELIDYEHKRPVKKGTWIQHG